MDLKYTIKQSFRDHIIIEDVEGGESLALGMEKLGTPEDPFYLFYPLNDYPEFSNARPLTNTDIEELHRSLAQGLKLQKERLKFAVDERKLATHEEYKEWDIFNKKRKKKDFKDCT